MSINVYKSLRQFAHKSATIRNQLSSFNICNARIPTQYCVYTPNVSAITMQYIFHFYLRDTLLVWSLLRQHVPLSHRIVSKWIKISNFILGLVTPSHRFTDTTRLRNSNGRGNLSPG